jgi:RNA polymerase sigma factor for flagellar operon FliA
LSRGERRKIKVIQIARERLRQTSGGEPGLGALAQATAMDADEISALLQADQLGRNQVSVDNEDEDAVHHHFHPATPREEVEARVDTAIVLRKLEGFFADLPERERMVIDAYLGVGLTPVEVAKSLKVTPSRVSQIYHSVVRRAADHFGSDGTRRATDRYPDKTSAAFVALVRQREEELRRSREGAWGDMVEQVLTRGPPFPDTDMGGLVSPSSHTRWG